MNASRRLAPCMRSVVQERSPTTGRSSRVWFRSGPARPGGCRKASMEDFHLWLKK
jgi:hypothetical protein